MLHGLLEALAQAEQDRGEVLGGPGPQLVVVAGLVERLPKRCSAARRSSS
jgi:hypothetical protein